MIAPDASFGPIIEYLDEETAFKDFASEFLNTIGTGIGGLAVERTAISVDQLPKSLVESLQSLNEVEVTPIAVGSGMSLHLSPDDPATIIRRNLAATHQVDGKEFSLPFQEESDGTQRFLNLLPALFRLQTGCQVFVIDELDRSLHPLLSHALLKFFVDSCPGACQQMIVTTHETHLLDLDLLRRDEIWFVEKDDHQQSHLYSHALTSAIRFDASSAATIRRELFVCQSPATPLKPPSHGNCSISQWSGDPNGFFGEAVRRVSRLSGRED